MTTQTTTQTQTPKPRRRFSPLFLALPLLIASASFAVAQGHGRNGHGEFGGFMQGRMERMLDAVGATDVQKTKIKAIWDAQQPQHKALREERRKLREQIEQAWAAPTIDKAAVEQLRRQSVQLMDKGSALFTQAMLSSAEVLSADQRKELLQQKREQRHHDAD